MSDPFKKLLRELKLLEKAQEAHERKKRRKAAWEVPGERAAYIREYKRELREKQLNTLTAGRRCAVCAIVRPKSRSWVIFPRVDIAGVLTPEADRVRAASRGPKCCCCRSCAMRHFKKELWS